MPFYLVNLARVEAIGKGFVGSLNFGGFKPSAFEQFRAHGRSEFRHSLRV